MWRILLATLLFPIYLFAEGNHDYVNPSFEGDPSANVFNAVNVMSGEFYISEDDLVVPGYEPIYVRRFYSSAFGDGSSHINLFQHLKLLNFTNYIILTEPNGIKYEYRYHKSNNWRIASNYFDEGMTNTAHHSISGRTNLKNQIIHYKGKEKYLVICPDKTLRQYKGEKGESRYYLQWEKRPSGSYVHYTYDDDKNLIRVETTNNRQKEKVYAWLTIERDDVGTTIKTSNGKTLVYHGLKNYYEKQITKITHTDRPDEQLKYYYNSSRKTRPLMQRRFEDGRVLQVNYLRRGAVTPLGKTIKSSKDRRIARVEKLLSPVNPDESLAPVYKFHYPSKKHGLNRKGEVVDAEGNRTRFDYTKSGRPEAIYFKDENGKDLLYQKNEWTCAKREGNTELRKKTFYSTGGKLLYQKKLVYDSNCNVKEEIEKGDFFGFWNKIEEFYNTDLYVSNSHETLSTKYEYNDDCQLTRKIDPDETVTCYSYVDQLDDLSTIKEYRNGHLIYSEEYKYNDDRILTYKCADYTTHKIETFIDPVEEGNGLGFPKRIIEKAGDIVLKDVEYTYNLSCQVTSETHFGKYTLEKEYDERGNLIYEKGVNGATTRYEYDDTNRCILEELPNGLVIKRSFDKAGRLAYESKGNQSLSYTYNANSKKIAETDHLGNTTKCKYDPVGNVIEIAGPKGKVIKKEYNWLGKETSVTDGNGNKTQIDYNSRGQPVIIKRPGKAVERYYYRADGQIAFQIDINGVKTRYKYDAFNKLIEKSTKGLSTKYTYENTQLIQKEDPKGVITNYAYDQAGRKILESENGVETRFEYDEFGNICRTIRGDRVEYKEYDFNGRIVCERVEDEDGHIYSDTQFGYDAVGNKISEISGSGIHYQTVYDVHGRVVKEIDGEGKETVINYEENETLVKTIYEPSGHHHKEEYDAYGNLVLETHFNVIGEVISEEEYIHDKNDNVIKQISKVHSKNDIWETTTYFEYNALNLPVRISRAHGDDIEQTTYHTYTSSKQLSTTLKPNGVKITRNYDIFDREISIESSDGSIDYSYEYDNGHRPILSRCNITGKETQLEYDLFDNVIYEKLSNGLFVRREYDELNRVTKLHYPDGSFVKYDYTPLSMRKISKFDPGGNLLYEHIYNIRNLSGDLMSETLINGDIVEYSYGDLGLPQKVTSKYFAHTIDKFDERNNVTKATLWGKRHSYDYDDHNQLIKERGYHSHNYTFDSHHNLLQKDSEKYEVNTLHELGHITYDENGNPTESGNLRLKYDAFDRLILIEENGEITTFEYDAWHRRISKKTDEIELYLYDDTSEIGAFREDFTPINLRVLGHQKMAEIGATIAIEIDHKIYAPLHDLYGNIVALTTENNKIYESYTFSAFGEEIFYTDWSFVKEETCNPWRFSSKRHDKYYIYFGSRYYDPTNCRWLTRDPAGQADGPHPYHYVHNSPLLNRDPTGLLTFPVVTQPSYENLPPIDWTKPPEGFYNWRVPSQIGDKPFGAVSYTNGLNCSQEDFNNHVREIELRTGVSINSRWAPSNGLKVDVFKYQTKNLFASFDPFGKPTIRSFASRDIEREFKSFHRSTFHDRNARLLKIGFSRGADDIRDALAHCPQEVRNKVKLRLFGPAICVSKNLCSDVRHYISHDDIVPILSKRGQMSLVSAALLEDSVAFLPTQPGALYKGMPFTDHSFMSPTYQERWADEIELFKKNYLLVK